MGFCPICMLAVVFAPDRLGMSEFGIHSWDRVSSGFVVYKCSVCRSAAALDIIIAVYFGGRKLAVVDEIENTYIDARPRHIEREIRPNAPKSCWCFSGAWATSIEFHESSY